jgi:hypothetical protein
MVVAMVILTVGLLGVASAIGYALMATNSGKNITNSKLLVVSVLEQMENLRDTGNLTFGQIANTGSVLLDNSGADAQFNGFPTGPQVVSTEPGPDGIFGTTDDLLAPASGGGYVTDNTRKVPNVTREIAITALSSTLRRVEVTVTYQSMGGKTQTISGVSYLNDDSHGNYIP